MKFKYFFNVGAAAAVALADYLIIVSDCIIAGRVINESALAAMNLLMPVFSFVTFVAWLFSFGTSVAYSRHLRRGNAAEAAQIGLTGIALATLTAFALVAIGCLFEIPYLTFMGPTDEVTAYSGAFWTWYQCVIPLQCVYMHCFYLVLRRGHERTCMASYGVQIVVNAALSYKLAEHYGMAGISLGTFFALLSSLLVLIPRLSFLKQGLGQKFHFNWRTIVRPFQISLPHASAWLFQSILFLGITKFVLVVWDSDSLPVCAVVFCTIRLTDFLAGLGFAFRVHEHKTIKLYRVASSAAFVLMGVVVALLFIAPELVASIFGIVSTDLVQGARFAARTTVCGLLATSAIAYLPLHFRLRASSLPYAAVNYLQGYILERTEYAPETQMFNLAKFFRLRKGIDLEKLGEALVTAAKSHPALWSTLEQNANGEILQREKIPHDSFHLPIHRNVNEAELLANKASLVKIFRPFGGRLFDAAIYDCGENAYLLSNFHHLICDGYSFPVILEDARRAYVGESLERDAYYDILKRRAEKSSTPLAETARAYLRESMKTRRFTTIPPSDLSRALGYGTSETDITVPNGFEKFLADHRITRHHVFLAATVVALRRLTGASDLLVDWVFHGRLAKDELKTVGAFMVDLPLVIENAEEMTLAELLIQVKRATFTGIKNVSVIRDISDCNPTAEDRITFIYQDEWGELMSPGPVRADGPYAWMIEETIPLTPLAAATENPFNVEIMEHHNTTKLFIEYDTGRYSAKLVARYADLFVQALAEICG